MYICECCQLSFKNFQSKANHIRWQHKDNSVYLEWLQKNTPNRMENRYGKIIENKVICPKCKLEFITKYREKFPNKQKKFCSKKCANSRAYRPISKESAESRSKKCRESMIRLWQNDDYVKMMEKANTKRRFTSKGEVEIRTHFINKYKDDGWTFGGLLEKDGVRMCRDLYSKKMKVCIEYDGIWHFKDIHGQLERKQFKDKKLKEWCQENGYRLIRIKEEKYKENKESMLQLLEDFSYKSASIYEEIYF